ncbi:DUF3854 domain-containing protein [Gloeocapsopsis crepidinum LEGE 06123]|uniref:DUF3854 domain-containing protein n=1 Tax=Gloeocapsopsis crepidinum LEGE 06123 TaxID=588587 RepID=A0ABR9UUZ8_9CHRO|nr:DUF3854 domain-containing protein [Gloeocapsopsis crepidinum]MBE9191395.1 DUF3854 domain-containing protein [Gloeocapsopsis crepidinum LEGE 06123]
MSQYKDICPNHIHREHFDEWVISSGVSPQITSRNIRSLVDSCEIDELLNRNTKHRWQHWEHGPGWSVTGVDPKTGEITYEGSQFKPDTPVHRHEDGKPKFKRDGSPDYQKYFNASNAETSPLFLDTGEPDYWLTILNTPSTRVLITEGAKKAGAALTCGEACISLPGVTNGQRKGRLKKDLAQFCTVGRTIVLAFDSDLFLNPNVCKALDKLGRLISAQGSVVKVLLLPPETKGIDDFIVVHGEAAFKQLVDEAMTFEEWKAAYPITPRGKSLSKSDFSDKETLYVPPAEDNYILQAKRCLYSNTQWISYNKNLYKWIGTHYELADADEEKRRIAAWCASTSVMTSYDWEYKYATATHVENIYNWLLIDFGIARSRINPPGINCLNGRLVIEWEGNKPRWQLQPHSPDIPYTYCSQFNFDPNADPSNCDRLLACLESEQQEIFIRTLAASLDLNKIRSLRGQRIRALLCKGGGNNGKDALRETVLQLYSIGVVGATINDFVMYDQGRKFPLAKLEGARVSWSSENSNFNQLDNLQTLKKVVTGDPLDVEHKNIAEYSTTPVAVFFFNINDAPNLQASLEAIKSRWAVLSFNKTFKQNADPSKGELEADPRFRYDPEFIRKEICPSLLNKMLAALPVVAREGIDYSCTDKALSDIQRDTNHLWAFCQDVGLDYQPGGRVYMGELHDSLLKWYVDNGFLTITTNSKGDTKRDWVEPSRRGDKLVKVSKDVCQRFQEIFPKTKRETDYTRGSHTGQVYLSGIGFTAEALHKSPAEALHKSPALTESAAEPHKALSATSYYIFQQIERLSVEERSALIKIVNQRWEIQNSDLAASAALPESVSDLCSASAGDLCSASADNSPLTSTDSPNAYLNVVSANRALNTGSGDITLGNTTKNFADQNQNNHTFKIGDQVQIDCPGSKYHGKIGTITRLKQGYKYGQTIHLADIRFPGVSRAWEAQVNWLRPVTPDAKP